MTSSAGFDRQISLWLPSIGGSFQDDYPVTFSAVLTETKALPPPERLERPKVTAVADVEIRLFACSRALPQLIRSRQSAQGNRRHQALARPLLLYLFANLMD